MKNSIDVRVEFSFKGNDYDLTSTIDLDAQNNALDIYQILARENKIDTMSYLYEVMQETDIEFSNAQGAAVDFLQEGQFNTYAFALHWHEHKIIMQLNPIAMKHMGITDLQQNSALKQALLEAYQLGRSE